MGKRRFRRAALGREKNKRAVGPKGQPIFGLRVDMSQSHARVWLHLVFSTKHRQPLLRDEGLRTEMFKMLAYNCQKIDCPTAIVGGWIDHIHILCGLSRTIAIADLIGKIKGETSGWAKDRHEGWRNFYWQRGYGAFSVSESLVDQVEQYIRDQQQHHQKMTFQEEFRILCQRHGIEIDERYVWD